MKIAYISDVIYPWSKGGVERRVWEIARRLADRHEVHWFGMKWWRGEDRICREGVILHGVCRPVPLYVRGKRSVRQALYFALMLFVPLLRERFDVIDCQEFPFFPCFLAKLHSIVRGSRLIVTWHEVWRDYWYEYLGLRGLFGVIVENVTMSLPGSIVTLTDRMRRELLAGRFAHKNIAVIPNGVDVDGIAGISAGNSRYDVVYVGRLVEHKCVEDLLRALAYVSARREVRCCIIGDGPERGALMKLAHELSLNCVDFLGFLESDEELVSYLKSAKVFVLPSKREGFCIALLESNASGIPCIVARHRSNYATELVVDGVNGFVTDAVPEAMGERILGILGNEELILQMRQTCISYARQFDWNVIALAMEREYEYTGLGVSRPEGVVSAMEKIIGRGLS